MSHSEAENNCQQFNGAHLASFVNQSNINKIIESLLRVEPYDQSWYFWTGLMYAKSSGTWSFIDGADITFAVSKVSLPQDVHNDQCVKIRGDGNLSVTHCIEERPFVCQDPTG